jgi:hypothetical protein
MYVDVVTIVWLYSFISVEIDRDRCWLVDLCCTLYLPLIIYKHTDAALEWPAILTLPISSLVRTHPLVKNSGFKLHASKDGTIAAHLT